jgi:hypothetical protein
MTNEPDKHETRLSLRASPATMEMVETYRRAQDKIPSRTNAIEALIEMGFVVWKKSQSEKQNGR